MRALPIDKGRLEFTLFHMGQAFRAAADIRRVFRSGSDESMPTRKINGIT
jgi:hypothetical protein